ncbi:ferrous iron transport protein B [Sinanaerobacter chloroacetimidivorans]|jgi:ferrous iron transport protein B|uniref:Ferrous iron transport protein B n=1 Tax=Sinanaerobacter chloroacetimidivorans TaxID=2818044 RepID=A0A8J7W346_9FIRM|nr:ferrous iron transport protein B [Sinanaerobacter chloroacetimidivorans]MBR0598293.1 ferrous iron transport protein B [Sinanaerobacter chloroacetimidivorans]
MGITIALAGNPNSGKTTMFNELTGSSQYVGNWPGVTVEKKEGKLKKHKDVTIMDLPGIYSLSPYTLEEVITRDYLIKEKPDVIINIVDSSNIERNLYLTMQLKMVGIPVIIALNMHDVVEKRGDKIDLAKLSSELGCEVIPTSAVKGTGLKELIAKAIQIGNFKTKSEVDPLFLKEAFGELDDDQEEEAVSKRYDYIQELVAKTVKKKHGVQEDTGSDKIDKIVTNRWLALPIFFVSMWIIYYISIVTVGDMSIGWVESLFGWIQGGAETLLVSLGAADWTMDLVLNGIIGSLGAIFTFVPQLMILFFFLSLLEDSGYMARVAFIMDRIFRRFGLSGKSFIPMLIGTGCSIPGVMASRTIEIERDRRMTIMLTPFIPCGAKLPVFAMFIAMMFREQTWVGPSIYLIGITGVILSGIILKKFKLFAGDPAPFVMELPTYKIPKLKGVTIHMWEKAKSFIKKAGTILFAACAIIWFLQNFSFTGYVGPEAIENSILAQIGNAIRWVFIPLGFGDTWAAPVAAITGLVAKEVVVATFASVGTIIPIMFSQVTAFAFMMFILFSAPCAAAIGAMKAEYGSWKWTLFAVGYQTGVAYVVALLINVIGNIIFKGTSYVTKTALDISLMEKAAESDVVNGNIVFIIFGVLLVIGLVITIGNKIRSSKDYMEISEVSTEKN